MKIVKLQAENIKRLTAVEIEPNGSVIKISGKNGAGKTSILDAIWWAMAGSKNITEKPIREGELSARIKLDIGELLIERKFTSKGTSLRVTASDGTPITKPQNVLDELLGKLTFDPLKFSRMKSREQFDELMTVVDIDHEEINRLDSDREKTFNLRTESNRDVKSLRTRIDAFDIPANAPTELIDPIEITNQLEQVSQIERSILDAKSAIESFGSEIQENRTHLNVREDLIKEALKHIEEINENIKNHNEKIEQHNSSIKENEKSIKEKQDFLDKTAIPDTTELREQLSSANETNATVNRVKEREQLRLDASNQEKNVSKLTDDIDKIDDEKRKLMTSATFPVEGLSFKSGEVLYQNLPFDQASAAEQLRVSMGMAMAVNPGFKVIRITDGSLMDSESFKIIESMAKDKDFQVWVEVVDETGDVGVVIEDGHVSKVNE